jgi:hypothetical protein
MKKKQKVNKLRLSRETLRDLEDSESQKVVGGDGEGSVQSGACCITRPSLDQEEC